MVAQELSLCGAINNSFCYGGGGYKLHTQDKMTQSYVYVVYQCRFPGFEIVPELTQDGTTIYGN